VAKDGRFSSVLLKMAEAIRKAGAWFASWWQPGGAAATIIADRFQWFGLGDREVAVGITERVVGRLGTEEPCPLSAQPHGRGLRGRSGAGGRVEGGGALGERGVVLDEDRALSRDDWSGSLAVEQLDGSCRTGCLGLPHRGGVLRVGLPSEHGHDPVVLPLVEHLRCQQHAASGPAAEALVHGYFHDAVLPRITRRPGVR
jgi:hypothetical protein